MKDLIILIWTGILKLSFKQYWTLILSKAPFMNINFIKLLREEILLAIDKGGDIYVALTSKSFRTVDAAAPEDCSTG